MAYNKVEANGQTLIDLTSDTVTTDTLVSGRTAHLASGEKVTGTFEPVTGVKGNAETEYRTGNVNLTAANIGLGNVNNTSDLDKPISTTAQAEFDDQQAQIDYNSNQGVKNLLYTKPITVTEGGVTATLISPNKYIISGSTTLLNISVFLIKNVSTGAKSFDEQWPDGNPFGTGDFIFSLKAPSGIFLQILIGPSTSTADLRNYLVNGNGSQKITLDSTDKYVWFRLAYNVSATTTYNNDKAEIMMRRAEIEDDTFEPYAEPNYQLTQKVDKALEQTGYNLLEITADTQTINGVTFIVDKAAGTITANGTATADVYYNVTVPSNVYGNVCLSGCANGGNNNTYDVFPRDNTVSARPTRWDGKTTAESIYKENQWAEVKYVQGHSNLIQIRIRSGATVSNLVFKPMIVPAELAGIPFQPYAKSNVELTQDLDDISEELECLLIQAALVNNEVVIQNTSDFTDELYSKYLSYTKPKFAILKLQITSNTYYYKALINSSSVSHGNLMEASFITVNGGYMGIYNFRWNFSSTVGTPTVSYTSLNLGS